MLESDCCNANAYFSLGCSHGIRMEEDCTYYGLCGSCKEQAVFTTNEKERETNEIAD